MNRSEIAANWKARGYSCGLFVDPPGRQWNDFVHSTDELVAVYKGHVRIIIGSESWDMLPGDEIFIPGGAVHSVHNINDGESSWLYGYN